MECPSCKAPLAEDARFCQRCGAPAPAAARAEPSDPLREVLKLALGRQYEVSRLLGKGGMGAVYLATEAALEREVAIKVLPPDRGATQDSRDRFRREARTAARLSHPNIVPLYTFGDVDGTLYFVMGYVKGESLAARLKRERRLSVEESRRILIEMADALDCAHKLGIVHRDIKPDNVLLEEGTGRAMLMDFGVAKALGAGQTMTEIGSVLGTPHYMSPEQAQGKANIDHRSDLYSLGVIGYAMLAGRLPFEGPTAGDVMAQHITREAPPLKSFAPDIPPDIATALTRCLAKDPTRRWSDARALKAAISEAGNVGPVPAPLVPVWRGVQVLAIGSFVGAFVLANAAMTPEPTDPLESRLMIDGLPRAMLALVMIAVVVVVGAALEARKLGHTWPEILHAARLKPDWWPGWYPARWRARNDVWERLPIELRRARGLLGCGSIVFLVWFPLFLLISLNASNFYQLTGRETALVRVDRVLTSLGRGVMAPPITLVALGFFLAWRWTRSRTASRLTGGLAGEAIGTDTAHRTFWSRPEVAALLLPPGSASSFSGKAPTSVLEMGAAISAALAGVGSELAGVRVKACDTARELTQALAALDHQIGALASAVDPAEAKRLVDRIAALDPDRGPNDLNREVREILQKQLDAVRSLESRIEETKSRRARRFELLKALWVQAVDLRTAAGDPVRISSATDRLRRLFAQIDQAGGSEANAVDSATEALPEAPTLER